MWQCKVVHFSSLLRFTFLQGAGNTAMSSKDQGTWVVINLCSHPPDHRIYSHVSHQIRSITASLKSALGRCSVRRGGRLNLSVPRSPVQAAGSSNQLGNRVRRLLRDHLSSGFEWSRGSTVPPQFGKISYWVIGYICICSTENSRNRGLGTKKWPAKSGFKLWMTTSDERSSPPV